MSVRESSSSKRGTCGDAVGDGGSARWGVDFFCADVCLAGNVLGALDA